MTGYAVFAEREKSGWADADISENYITGFGPVVDAAGEAHPNSVVECNDVLDLCCGQGTLTARLLEAGHKVTGLDFSTTMLDHARQNANGATLVEGDAQDLPFDDGTFDAVVCNFGMMHIPDQPAALSEARRVLKPGGTFSMTSWVGPEVPGVFQLIFGTVRANLPDGMAPPPAPDFFIYGREAEARELLMSRGLKVATFDILPLGWPLASPDDLYETFFNGTVGARMTLMALDDATRHKVATIITDTVAQNHVAENGYSVPVSVAHIVAKPAT
ncbi:MAG: class I SAM-dependent methyltransferase [Boseongicola sp.]